MTKDEMKTLVHRMYTAANAGDISAVDDLFAPDFYSHPMGKTGVDAVKNAWREIRARHPELRVEADDIIADGDTIAVRSSVYASPDQREPATLMEMMRVADGRIAELWGVTTLNWR